MRLELSPGDLSRGPPHASRRGRLSRIATAPPGTLGMPGFLYAFINQADCANPAGHFAVVRTVRNANRRGRPPPRVQLSPSRTTGRLVRSGSQIMQDGLSRAIP